MSPNRLTRKRSTIYDEHQYRLAKDEQRWKPKQDLRVESEPLNIPYPEPAATTSSPDARDVGGVYRALRKGREDAKDASGASDFYFGEMEMRRRLERDPLLWLYLRVSGYGTRGLRSAIAFLLLVAAAALAMHRWGFDPTLCLGRSITFTLGSTVYLARPPEGYELTGTGDVLQLVLRTLGPLLLGLTLLALRARVKR